MAQRPIFGMRTTEQDEVLLNTLTERHNLTRTEIVRLALRVLEAQRPNRPKSAATSRRVA